MALGTGELPSEEELQAKLRPGDAFLHFGYYRRPRACYERCREAGAEVAFESIATGGAALSELSADTGEVTRAVPEEGWGADEPEPTVSIDCRFPLGDGVVSVQVIPSALHVLGRISPIFSPFFPVFSPFPPSCPQDSGNRHQDPENGPQRSKNGGQKQPFGYHYCAE